MNLTVPKLYFRRVPEIYWDSSIFDILILSVQAWDSDTE
jgi:hypothetical protein